MKNYSNVIKNNSMLSAVKALLVSIMVTSPAIAQAKVYSGLGVCTYSSSGTGTGEVGFQYPIGHYSTGYISDVFAGKIAVSGVPESITCTSQPLKSVDIYDARKLPFTIWYSPKNNLSDRNNPTWISNQISVQIMFKDNLDVEVVGDNNKVFLCTTGKKICSNKKVRIPSPNGPLYIFYKLN